MRSCWLTLSSARSATKFKHDYTASGELGYVIDIVSEPPSIGHHIRHPRRSSTRRRRSDSIFFSPFLQEDHSKSEKSATYGVESPQHPKNARSG